MYVPFLLSVLLSTLSLTTSAVSVPLAADVANATDTADTIGARGSNPGVYICTVQNWSGLCNYHANIGLGTCYTRELTALASFGPDHGLTCTLYSGPNCGRSGPAQSIPGVAYPGLNPIRDGMYHNFWSAQSVESWKCDNG